MLEQNSYGDIIVRASGEVFFVGKVYRAVIGKSGLLNNKKEGDGATPVGIFPIRKVLYREDRIKKPLSVFETEKISPSDAWSDAVEDVANYNTQVSIPYHYHHEKLWRDEDTYNIIVPLGYNDDLPIAGKGSAIFMHIARTEYPPTEGCIALSEVDLREILQLANKETKVHVLSPEEVL